MKALVATLALGLCACTPMVKTQIVKVPVYIAQKPDAILLQQCKYAEPDPACWVGGKHQYCNGQLAQMIVGYRDELARCNADKSALTKFYDGK